MNGSKKTTSSLILVAFGLALLALSANDIVRCYARVGPRHGLKHSVLRAADPHAFWRATGVDLALGTGVAVCGLFALFRKSGELGADDGRDLPAPLPGGS